MRASIRELRIQTKAILSEIERGNPVTLTYRGVDYAKIIPIKKPQTKIKEDEAFGMWKDNKKIKSVKEFVDDIRGAREV